MNTIHAQYAWLTGESAVPNVRITVEHGLIAVLETNVEPHAGDERIIGVVMPGFINVHSHAFHRALRGRTHTGKGDFWSWRTLMYEVANRLNPENYLALATAVFTEMALAGITGVGEFHYVHHQPNGRTYGDPNEMGRVVIEAARRAGIRLALLDVAYLHRGLDTNGVLDEQRRFSDSSIEQWLDRVELLGRGDDLHTIGLAPHSVRAVHLNELAVVAQHRDDRVVHIHVSEQPAENDACRAVTGRTPTRMLADSGLLGPFATAVHATHLDASDISLLGSSKTTACFCPTTERDLADGIGPSYELTSAGATLALGTDSHASIDMFEEARAVEMHQRLITNQRGVHRSSELLESATTNGARALGWRHHGLMAGARADFVAISLESTRLATFDPAHGAAHLVHSASAADVRNVWVGGERIVSDRTHRGLASIADALRTAVSAVLPQAQ